MELFSDVMRPPIPIPPLPPPSSASIVAITYTLIDGMSPISSTFYLISTTTGPYVSVMSFQ
jgi:Na+/H+ antiporter NhaC